jgi:hypothetical protein
MRAGPFHRVNIGLTKCPERATAAAYTREICA